MMKVYEEVAQKIKDLKLDNARRLYAIHLDCRHPVDKIIEGRYRSSNYFGATAPFRVCSVCGYAEEGWGCGYWKLAKDTYNVREMHPDDAQQFVLKFHSQDDMAKLRFKR